MATYKPTTETGKCPFCEIVTGNLQTPGIYWEDDSYVAFLSIDPNTEGFSCVIPKDHFGSDILKMPDNELQNFIIAAKKVARILEDYFDDVGRVGLIMEGTGIDHAHIKLFPMHGTENLEKGEWQQVFSNQSKWFDTYEGWISSAGGPMADKDELAKLAQNIKDSIK